MAATAKHREDTAFRYEYILELIKSSKDGVKGREIDEDCGIKPKTRYKIMKDLMAEHPEIVRMGTYVNPIYIWKEMIHSILPVPTTLSVSQNLQKAIAKGDIDVAAAAARALAGTKSPFLKNRAEKATRNSEGYSDPTAGKAIENVSKNEKDRPFPGEVWSASESNGTTSCVYVVAAVTGGVLGIRLLDADATYKPSKPISLAVWLQGKFHNMVGDYERVGFKPAKYLKERVRYGSPSEEDRIRRELAEALKLQHTVYKTQFVDREVVPKGYISKEEALKKQEEVIREGYISKEEALKMQKEVVKEVIPEGYISPEEALKRELDIWKEVAMRLLKKGDILCK